MINKKFIILVRHSQALKNIEKKHGGIGSKLTLQGINDTIRLSEQLLSEFYNFKSVVYSPKPQCEETASILSKRMSIPKMKDLILKPISLGIIDGLSDKEVQKSFPVISKNINDWRNGNIEINELSIPNMEDQNVFYQRGKDMLSKIIKTNQSTIVVLTRSLLVLTTNILLNRTTEKGGNYREIKWKNSEYAVFSIDENGLNFHINLSTVRI